jgi:hypothetical protein
MANNWGVNNSIVSSAAICDLQVPKTPFYYDFNFSYFVPVEVLPPCKPGSSNESSQGEAGNSNESPKGLPAGALAGILVGAVSAVGKLPFHNQLQFMVLS